LGDRGPLPFECFACGVEIPLGTHGSLWIAAPLGLTNVKVCRTRECAELAVKETGGRWTTPPRTREERATEKLKSG
jgi:hypothetical protein